MCGEFYSGRGVHGCLYATRGREMKQETKNIIVDIIGMLCIYAMFSFTLCAAVYWGTK